MFLSFYLAGVMRTHREAMAEWIVGQALQPGAAAGQTGHWAPEVQCPQNCRCIKPHPQSSTPSALAPMVSPPPIQ